MTLGSILARLPRAHTRIAARLLLFNLLLVFLPVAGLLYLDAYEDHLLDQQERSMADVGRVTAALLATSTLDPAYAARAMQRVGQRTDARIRVVLPTGEVIADTHLSRGTRDEDLAGYASAASDRSVRLSLRYRLGARLGRILRWFIGPSSVTSSADQIDIAPGRVSAPEVTSALAGRYGAATRLSPGGQRSVTLSIALPITADTGVQGAVLVTQSTFRILQGVYATRLRMFSIVIVSIALAVVLMLVASMTLVTPVRRLRDDAESVADRRGRLRGRFRGAERRDEIGELARALNDLAGRLDTQLRFSERFAADVSHEFRNPLASIRASAELIGDADDPAQRATFLATIERDIRRLESLIRGVRDITVVDTQLEEEPRAPVDLVALVSDAITERGHGYAFERPRGPLFVDASPDRLAQVIRNVFDNAESFSPADAAIDVAITSDARAVTLTVRDRGPGIPAEHASRVFDRFFSHRPGHARARTEHTGLGLSIAKAIVDSYGGAITAGTHETGGAIITVTLPHHR